MRKNKQLLYRSYKFQFRCMRWQGYYMGAYPRYLKLYDALHCIHSSYWI